jgi:hypothetical protein
MAKKKKHEILGGIKVSSEQLSEWGSLGGRPKKYLSNAERARAFRLRKKQEKFGAKAELRDYKSYGEVQIKKSSITCPKCGRIEKDLGKYFNEKGELIKETYWFDTVRMEKVNVRENYFHCSGCSWIFSFKSDELVVKEIKTVIKKAGNVRERLRRLRGKLTNL